MPWVKAYLNASRKLIPAHLSVRLSPGFACALTPRTKACQQALVIELQGLLTKPHLPRVFNYPWTISSLFLQTNLFCFHTYHTDLAYLRLLRLDNLNFFIYLRKNKETGHYKEKHNRFF